MKPEERAVGQGRFVVSGRCGGQLRAQQRPDGERGVERLGDDAGHQRGGAQDDARPTAPQRQGDGRAARDQQPHQRTPRHFARLAEVNEYPLQKAAPGDGGAPQRHDLHAGEHPVGYGSGRAQPVQHNNVEERREGDGGGDGRDQNRQVQREAAYQQVGGAVAHQRRRGRQQVDDRAFDGDREAHDDALRRQHDDLVRQPVDGRADDGAFGRHQQPACK